METVVKLYIRSLVMKMLESIIIITHQIFILKTPKVRKIKAVTSIYIAKICYSPRVS